MAKLAEQKGWMLARNNGSHHVYTKFTKHILRMPLPWRLWVAALFMTNMGSLVLLPRMEAWVVLGSLCLGALLQNVIFARFGFVRLLGLGHVHWFAMLTWLPFRLDSVSDESWLHCWVLAVIILCGMSLVIGLIDVLRYLRGEREPTIVLKEESAWQPVAADGPLRGPPLNRSVGGSRTFMSISIHCVHTLRMAGERARSNANHRSPPLGREQGGACGGGDAEDGIIQESLTDPFYLHCGPPLTLRLIRLRGTPARRSTPRGRRR